MKSGQRNNLTAFVRTALVFLLLLAILIYVKLRTPNPPYPEGGGGAGEGLEINLGTDELGADATGEMQDENISDPEEVSETEKPEDEKLLTSEDEESEAIKQIPVVEKKPEKVIPKKTEQSKPKIKETPKPEPAKEPAPVVNQRALYGKQKNMGDGTSAVSGNQGSPNGSNTAGNYSGAGSGTGTGSGVGSGSGSGTGNGNGPAYSLDGRNPQFLPSPEYNSQVEGRVVVKIIVDNDGKVISATAGVKGSTTLDDYLLSVAKNAALKARFSRKPDAPDHQEGTISYKFILQ